MVNIKYALRDGAGARDGKWIPYDSTLPGTRICIRFADHGPFLDRMAELIAEGKKPDVAQLQAACELLLVAWEGFDADSEGTPLELTDEVRKQLWSDPDWRVIGSNVLHAAKQEDFFRKHKRSELVGKSEGSSSGA